MMARVLLLDYSVDRSEAPLFSRWLPESTETETAFVHFGEPIPDPAPFTHVMHTGSSLTVCRDAPFVPEAAEAIRRCADLGIPQLGVCYGHQLLCRVLVGAGAVRRCPCGIEAGWLPVRSVGPGLSIPGCSPEFTVLQSHFDEVVELPPGSELVMTGEHSRVQGFVNRALGLFGMQFHPEFDRESGNTLFRREREMLEGEGLDVDRMLLSGPSLDAGRVFFHHFLAGFEPTKARDFCPGEREREVRA